MSALSASISLVSLVSLLSVPAVVAGEVGMTLDLSHGRHCPQQHSAPRGPLARRCQPHGHHGHHGRRELHGVPLRRRGHPLVPCAHAAHAAHGTQKAQHAHGELQVPSVHCKERTRGQGKAHEKRIRMAALYEKHRRQL